MTQPHTQGRVLTHFPPFYAHLGIQPPKGSERELTIVRRDALLNSAGNVHGGVLLGLLDAALSRAIRLALPEGIRLATVDLTVQFVAAARGEAVHAVGELTRKTETLAFAHGQAVDDEGQTLATALGVYRLFRPRADDAKPTTPKEETS